MSALPLSMTMSYIYMVSSMNGSFSFDMTLTWTGLSLLTTLLFVHHTVMWPIYVVCFPAVVQHDHTCIPLTVLCLRFLICVYMCQLCVTVFVSSSMFVSALCWQLLTWGWFLVCWHTPLVFHSNIVAICFFLFVCLFCNLEWQESEPLTVRGFLTFNLMWIFWFWWWWWVPTQRCHPSLFTVYGPT